jgi:hypothetical protein
MCTIITQRSTVINAMSHAQVPPLFNQKAGDTAQAFDHTNMLQHGILTD